MFVPLNLLCRYRHVRRANLSFRGVLPCVCVCVCESVCLIVCVLETSRTRGPKSREAFLRTKLNSFSYSELVLRGVSGSESILKSKQHSIRSANEGITFFTDHATGLF